MKTTNELMNFCDTWLDAWTGNQPEQLLSFYSETAFYQDPANPQGLERRSDLSKYFTKLLARYPDWQWTRSEFFPTDKGFVLKWRAEIPRNGSAVVFYGMDLVELEDRLISRNEVYFDPGCINPE